MRALCPVGVTALTVAQLEERAIEQGSLYPRELALRLKVSFGTRVGKGGRRRGAGGRIAVGVGVRVSIEVLCLWELAFRLKL